MTLPFWAIVGI